MAYKFVAVFAYCCSRSAPIAVAEADRIEELPEVMASYGIDILKHEDKAEDIKEMKDEQYEVSFTQYRYLKENYPKFVENQDCICGGDECNCPAHIYPDGCNNIYTTIPTDGLEKVLGGWPSMWEEKDAKKQVVVGVIEIEKNKPMFAAVPIFEDKYWH